MRSLFVVVVLSFLSLVASSAQTLAFPEAVGFGRYASGGRGGEVVRVTNLNDSGPGSLRDAISQPNRIIIFDVGGVIHLQSRLVFKSNQTIAGQTAPGEGIVVYGQGVSFSGAHNVIVRHIAFRMGLGGGSGHDAIGIANGSNMIFDHVSVSWGRDEVFSINWDNKGTEPSNITIQNSIIAQGLQGHSAGGLMQTNGGVTLFRNLYIDNHTRNPKVKGLNQFVNNVVYNWGGGACYILGDSEGTSWATIVNNYFINGPSADSKPYSRANNNFQLFAQGNYHDGNKNGLLDGILNVQSDYGPAYWVESPEYWENLPEGDPKKIPQMHPEIPDQMTAEEAYYWIVDNVGKVLPVRDQVDDYLIWELTSLGTEGAIISSENELPTNGPGIVFGGHPLADTDADGIPDVWEDILGCDKNVDDAMEMGQDGYTNIERYINSITEAAPYFRYPLNVMATQRNTTSITLGWINLEDKADELVVEMSIDNETFEEILRVAGDAISSGPITDLTSGTTYYFRIKAVSEEVESLYSAVYSVATQSEALPPSPSINPFPANGDEGLSYNNLKLSWDNSTSLMGGIIYYTIYMGTNPEDLEVLVDDISGKFYTVTSLEQNKTYYWKVKAVNLLGEDESEIWSFTTALPIERNMIFHMPFDESGGSTTFDVISSESAQAVNFTPKWQAGKIGNSIYFPGSPSDSHIKFAHNENLFLDNQSFSIVLWFKSPGSEPDSYLLHKGMHDHSNNGNGKWIGIQYRGSRFTFAIDDDIVKTDLNITNNPAQWFNNEWHHLVCIRNREENKLQMYINSVLVGEISDGTTGIGETGDLILGNRNGYFDNPYPGNLDDLRIYDAALTADEVFDLFKSTITKLPETELFVSNTRVFPNPFSSEITLYCPDCIANSQVEVRIYDVSGVLMLNTKQEVDLDGGIYLSGLSVLPPGLYICKVLSASGPQLFKLMKH